MVLTRLFSSRAFSRWDSLCVLHIHTTLDSKISCYSSTYTQNKEIVYSTSVPLRKWGRKSPTSPLLAYAHKRQLEHICTVPVLGLLLLRQTPWPEARGGRVYFVFQLSGLHWRHVGQDPKQEPGKLLTGLRLIPSMATKLNTQLLYTIQDHGPKGSTTHNGLRPPLHQSLTKKKNKTKNPP